MTLMLDGIPGVAQMPKIEISKVPVREVLVREKELREQQAARRILEPLPAPPLALGPNASLDQPVRRLSRQTRPIPAVSRGTSRAILQAE
jgi:hypothetical protein